MASLYNKQYVKNNLHYYTFDIPLGTDKLEHGIDCNDSDDDFFGMEDDTPEAEEDVVDSCGEYIRNEAPAHCYSANMDQILSIQNLPGCANYGLEFDSGSLTQRNIKNEVGIQVDLQDQ